ncbi:MAG: hypothetical protein K9N51_07900, partial [Candidatus Pacebacteria bacterium]|nr:hypothetical protein [Candidatus Paceibacterota bacterium]
SARWRGEMPDFDSRLNSRARALHLTHPLSQAIYYSALLFGPATPEVRAQESASGPPTADLRPPSSVFRHIYLRALLPPRSDRYGHARDRIHYALRHYPPDLWRKSIRPKLERVFGNKGAILPRSTSPSVPIRDIRG